MVVQPMPVSPEAEPEIKSDRPKCLSDLCTISAAAKQALFLLRLACFQRLLRFHGRFVGGNRPFLQLHSYAVRAGLDDNPIIRNMAYGADNTADGRDFIANLQILAHLVHFFFLLVFGPNQEVIEDENHDENHQDC